MEVHSHTHPDSYRDHRKKWTHYLWEFLMLFLAVFCGFLAENQREHMVEHQREKKYVRQLLSDLRADSAFFVRLSTALDTIISHYKRFEEVMSSASPTNYDILKAYIKLQSTFTMRPTATTYSEMKSSGSFRYIQNEELTTLIKKYYEGNLDFLKTNEDLGNDFFKTQVQPFTISHFRMADIDFMNDKLSTPTPVFINRNKESELQLMNIMNMYYAYLLLYHENAVKPAAKRLNSIIDLLKKDYHLK